jgi:hypothetical protein
MFRSGIFSDSMVLQLSSRPLLADLAVAASSMTDESNERTIVCRISIALQADELLLLDGGTHAID